MTSKAVNHRGYTTVLDWGSDPFLETALGKDRPHRPTEERAAAASSARWGRAIAPHLPLNRSAFEEEC